jgi:hypothetical protein
MGDELAINGAGLIDYEQLAVLTQDAAASMRRCLRCTPVIALQRVRHKVADIHPSTTLFIHSLA